MKRPFIYQLPLVRSWHAHYELKPQKGKTYRYFGYNWWDIVYSGLWEQSKYFGQGKYILPFIPETTGIALINCSNKKSKIKNKISGDVYNLGSYGYSLYNIKDRRSGKNVLIADQKDCVFNFVKCGDSFLVLINIQDLINGKSTIVKTSLYKDFMLACGILNPSQYYATVGLNAFLNKITVQGKNIDLEMDSSMYDWVQYCSDHWEETNPTSKKSLPSSQQIPNNVHFIWLSKTPGKPNPLKDKFKKFIKTWIFRNPECNFYIWTDSSDVGLWPDLKDTIQIMYWKDILDYIKKLPGRWKSGIMKLLRSHPNVGVRADTLRQIVLYSMGGIYADINDMSCTMPLENFRQKFDFMVGMEPMMYVNNAFIATKKKHIVNKNFLEFISQYANDFINDWDPDLPTEEKDNLVVSETGPIAFSGILFGVFETNYDSLRNSCIFPCSWVYPNYEITDVPESWLKPISITSHYDARDYLKAK